MMFGHDHKDKDEEENITRQPAQDNNAGTDTVNSAPPAPQDISASEPTSAPEITSTSTPIVKDSSISDSTGDTSTDTVGDSAVSNDDVDENTTAANDLLNLKQQALQQLAPLVNELDQTPEEKFHTTMMMIQASDNQDLIQKAYEAAEQINDSKVKAQALLDIVNEINYFIHQQPNS